MKIFLDTANVEEVREALEWGVVDGVTTNPASVASIQGRSQEEILEEMVKVVTGPVAAQVVAQSSEEMIEQGINLAKIAPNMVVKIPMGTEGLAAMRKLHELDIATHCTLIFNASQALLAAKAGATYVSPFVGRLDAMGQAGMDVVAQIVSIFDNYGFATEVMVASIKDPRHVVEAAIHGADACTMPLSILKAISRHPQTDAMSDQFLKNWTSSVKQ